METRQTGEIDIADFRKKLQANKDRVTACSFFFFFFRKNENLTKSKGNFHRDCQCELWNDGNYGSFCFGYFCHGGGKGSWRNR